MREKNIGMIKTIVALLRFFIVMFILGGDVEWKMLKLKTRQELKYAENNSRKKCDY